jgi:2-polyprenyl-6-hydroxyphenyl methylase/3-demethylubiquinone-9 3-methyltransferase
VTQGAPLGQRLRGVLGPATDPVARWYRHWYVDLESFGRSLGRLGTVATVLEIGAGDGHLCEQLAARFPDATVLGIDVAAEPGRLYRGRTEGVTFEQRAASELAATGRAFDLVVLCDVLHHVAPEDRTGLVRTARRLVAPGGWLAVKDWERGRDLGTLASKLSDTYVTGDDVSFFPTGGLERLLTDGCPGDVIVAEGRVPPRRNNQYFVVRAAQPT